MTTAASMFRARMHARRDPAPGFRRWIACVSVASALFAAGCGGGSQTTASTPAIAANTPSGPALSTSQLIARADAICKRRNTAIDAVKLHGASAAAITAFAAQSSALEQAAYLELTRLGPPASMAAQWQQVLAYTRTLLEDVVELGQYGKQGDTQAIPALSRSVVSVKRELLTAARHDGFRYCSRVR